MSEKKSRGASGAGGSGGVGGAGAGAPGKRTRTQSLPPSTEPQHGPSIERVRARPVVTHFKATEIGKASHEELTLTNTSDSPVDFFDFLGRVLVTTDGKVRPDGDFAVVGGATTGEPLEPDASTQVTVAFTPEASHADDMKPRKNTKRAAEFSILDFDGAVAGKIEVEGRAKAPSDDTVDAGEVGEIKSTVRRGGNRLPPPKSFDEMRRHLMAARDLMETSEREQAAELVSEVYDRMYEALRYDQVLQKYKSGHGLGTQNATWLVADASDRVRGAATLLADNKTVDMDRLVITFLAAQEPIQFTLGEIDHSPTIRAVHDASPAVMAGKVAVELGHTAKEFVSDGAFAAGFSIGVLEGAGGALKDLATGVADALELAFDIVRAMTTGGLVGAAIHASDKVSAFFEKAPEALAAMGAAFEQGWNADGSFDRGNFRGEVIGYVAAQIAIIVISGGAAAEGVAFATLSRWGKVASVIQKLDAAGDIAAWAQAAGRGIKLPRKLMDKLGDARKQVDAGGGEPEVDVPGAAIGSSGKSPESKPSKPWEPRDCFVAGTPVWTPDGLVPIELLAVDGVVTSTDLATRRRSAQRVAASRQRTVPMLVDIELAGTVISCSAEHPFWIERLGWCKAGALECGMVLTGLESRHVVTSVSRRTGEFTVYNLEVDTLHTYHVSALAILVHNKAAANPFFKRRNALLEALAQDELRAAKLAEEISPTGEFGMVDGSDHGRADLRQRVDKVKQEIEGTKRVATDLPVEQSDQLDLGIEERAKISDEIDRLSSEIREASKPFTQRLNELDVGVAEIEARADRADVVIQQRLHEARDAAERSVGDAALHRVAEQGVAAETERARRLRTVGERIASLKRNKKIVVEDPTSDSGLGAYRDQLGAAERELSLLESELVKGHMLGAGGTRVMSHTLWKGENGSERIDVENPAPGRRPGQIHYQPDAQHKWYYDPVKREFYDEKTKVKAPPSVQAKLNDPEFQQAIDEGMRYLGEGKTP